MSDPIDVRSHVWESLVSMLNVYAHAAGLNGSPYIVTSCSNDASVKHEDSLLSLHFNPGTGGVRCVPHRRTRVSDGTGRPKRNRPGSHRLDRLPGATQSTHGRIDDPICPHSSSMTVLGHIVATERGVPHISLVFREMWDTTSLT